MPVLGSKTGYGSRGQAATPPGDVRTAGLVAGRCANASTKDAPKVRGPRPAGNLDLLASSDASRQRVLKTPSVFQSSKEQSVHKQRELRSNLLPSIMWAPLDNNHRMPKGDFKHTEQEAMGDFHRQYQEELESRAKAEDEVAIFLDRDPAFADADKDPMQIVAANCSVLKDLVADKLTKFRRAQDCLVNTSSELPFLHKDQGVDLAELSDVFTLDLERKENFQSKNGFLSLQLTARLPMLVSDPTSGVNLTKLESERLDKDLHMIRLDLNPGEVRHVAYSLDNKDFRQTSLAGRMSAVIDPERSVLAELVRTLRAKESEAKTVNKVLSDVLRDMPDNLPPAVEPNLLDKVGEQAAEARLNDLLQGPRGTLRRMLDSIEKLAALAAPLAPSLAHALDRIGLICVREVDRLAVRCHHDYEHVLNSWSKAEQERRELKNLIDRMGGKEDKEKGSGGVELRNRVGKLHNDLMQQEQLYSNLLSEYREHVSGAEESHRLVEGLRNKVHELQGEVAELQRNRRDANQEQRTALQAGKTVQSVSTGDDFLTTSEPREQASGSPRQLQLTEPLAQTNVAVSGTTANLSPRPVPKSVPLTREGLKSYADGLLSFNVPVSTQTPTNHFFHDSADLADELTQPEYEDIMSISNRLFAILCKYEWNAVASKYFLKVSEGDSDNEAPTVSRDDQIQMDPRLSRMLALRVLKTKVERSHVRAQISQMEEENYRLVACAKEGFDVWVKGLSGALAKEKNVATDEAVKPDELWEEITKFVHNDGMRTRVRELEEHLSNLLPLAERARGGDGGIDGGETSLFWKRVMKQVQQSDMSRKVPKNPNSKDSHAAQWARNRRRSSLGESALFDSPRLLAELAAIWASLISQRTENEAPRVISGRIPTQSVLQACIKTFYLRKSGRSKFVEAAVVALCKAVRSHVLASPKIPLFAVMTDISSPASLEGKFPTFRRPVDLELNPKILHDLPLDAAYVMAKFMRELKSLRRSKKFAAVANGEDGAQDSGDHLLPIQLILAAGRTSISNRSQATSKWFHLAILGFGEFSPRLLSSKIAVQLLNEAAVSDASADPGSPSSPTSPRNANSAAPILGLNKIIERRLSQQEIAPAVDGAVDGDGGGRTRYLSEQDKTVLQEMVYCSHLINAYVWQRIAANAAVGMLATAETDREKEEEVLSVLWSRLMEQAQSVSAIRRSLGLGNDAACTGKKVAECLVKWGVVPLPVDVVARSIRLACGMPSDAQGDVHMDQPMFVHFCQAHHFSGDDGGVRVRESIVLWAGIWALCYERTHEIEQMGALFQLYDSSGDGWLQFDEFALFMKAVAPNIRSEDTEELFLCGAEEVQGDMTKDVFLTLVLRLGITSDIDMLDELIIQKKPVVFEHPRSLPAHPS